MAGTPARSGSPADHRRGRDRVPRSPKYLHISDISGAHFVWSGVPHQARRPRMKHRADTLERARVTRTSGPAIALPASAGTEPARTTPLVGGKHARPAGPGAGDPGHGAVAGTPAQPHGADQPGRRGAAGRDAHGRLLLLAGTDLRAHPGAARDDHPGHGALDAARRASPARGHAARLTADRDRPRGRADLRPRRRAAAGRALSRPEPAGLVADSRPRGRLRPRPRASRRRPRPARPDRALPPRRRRAAPGPSVGHARVC